MKLLTCILTANRCYQTGQKIKPKGVMVHSTGANNPTLRRYVQPIASTSGRAELLKQLGTNPNSNDWNREGQWVQGKWVPLDACVHGFIGKLADGSIATVRTLPWNHRGWHAGNGTSGRSANDTHISFEICEDGLADPAYFQKVYREAVELTAMLCKQYGLNPLADGVVICHQEGYRRGVASNHGDVLHWFPRFGKGMDDFRADVAAELGQRPIVQFVLQVAKGYDAAKVGTYTATAAAGLNIRVAAGTDATALGTLAEGTQVACYGYYNTENGADWLLVAANGVTGYVCAEYLKAEAVPAVDGSNDSNTKEDDDMKIFARLGDVADSYKPTIRKLMERGALKGHKDPDPNSLEDNVLNISEDYCRVMATLDRLGVLD